MLRISNQKQPTWTKILTPRKTRRVILKGSMRTILFPTPKGKSLNPQSMIPTSQTRIESDDEIRKFVSNVGKYVEIISYQYAMGNRKRSWLRQAVKGWKHW